MIDFHKRHAQIATTILSLERLHKQNKAAKMVAQPSGLRGLFSAHGVKMLTRRSAAQVSGLVAGVGTLVASGAVAAVAQQVTPHATTEACFALFAVSTFMFGAYNTLKSIFKRPAPQPKSAQAKAFREARRATRTLANSVRYAYTPA